MKVLQRKLIFIPLALIALLYFFTGILTFKKFRNEFISAERANQQKMTRIINQSLNLYFDKLKFAVENAAIQDSFHNDKSIIDDHIRFNKFKSNDLIVDFTKLGIKYSLKTPRNSSLELPKKNELLYNWQVFKALPEFDLNGKLIANDRRNIARNILKTFKDIHYVFEMDQNGDLIFLEPFNIQKNISSFNYEFRDYLQLAKKYKTTAISEGYISHDKERTQVVTVATPIFDKKNNVVKILAASVSSTMVREKVFRSLKESMAIEDGTVFYLIDRHGHVVASSSGNDIYFPKDNIDHDENDKGNVRNLGFFQTIKWLPDILEKGNIWERATKSWQVNSLKEDFFGEYKNLSNIMVLGSFFPISILGSDSINLGILIETPVSKLQLAEKDLRSVFLLFGIILFLILLTLFIILVKSFNQFEEKLLNKETEIVKISAQVAHDIRSPLSALDMITSDFGNMPEERRIIIRSAVNRIKDIANSLLIKKNNQRIDLNVYNEELTIELLPSLIEELITEKRTQYRSKIGLEIIFNIQPSSYGVFAKVQAIEMKRVLSNLINNSVEALGNLGKVIVSVDGDQDSLNIYVRDNGSGIPPHILPKLTSHGFTHQKLGGSGLGLHHAKKSIENWQGSLTIQSELNVGTTVTIYLPRAIAPSWFVPKLTIFQNQSIVILDDDNSIHQIWQDRFDTLKVEKQEISIIHFSTSNEVRQWCKSNRASLYLFDYELIGDSSNGLHLIEELKIEANSILVTSRYEETNIRDICDKLKIKLIPKSIAAFVPIDIIKNIELTYADAILIDDDDLVHLTWHYCANEKNKLLRSFKSIEDFMLEAKNFNLNSPIYIDVLLGKNKDGISISGNLESKIIYELGFKNIFLVTGLTPNEVDKGSWIKEIKGKEAPF